MGPTPQAPQPYQAPHQPGQAYTEQPYQPAEEGIVVPGEDGSWFQRVARGGAASKHTPTQKAQEIYRCPECGGNNFFTRSTMGAITTERGRMTPAPICDECGYNGLFEQFGNQPDVTGEQQ